MKSDVKLATDNTVAVEKCKNKLSTMNYLRLYLSIRTVGFTTMVPKRKRFGRCHS